MTKSEIQNALRDLKAWADTANTAVGSAVSDADATAAVGRLASDNRVTRVLPLLEPPPISFEDFINRMGRSLVTAQEMLDIESGKYLTSIAGQPHILPSIFRIPKISAQMKFGLRVDKEQQLNLVFFSTRDQTQSQNEQAIDFEIASVPAPPGAAQQLLQTGPSLDLVLDPLLHAKLISLILQAPATDPDTAPLVTAAKDPKLASRIAALTVVAAPGKAPRHLLFHATNAAEKAVGLWLLTHPIDAAPTLETVYKFTTANGKSEKIIRDIILELGDRLEKLFA